MLAPWAALLLRSRSLVGASREPPVSLVQSRAGRLAGRRLTGATLTVAEEIELPNKFENMGAQMVREVASFWIHSP